MKTNNMLYNLEVVYKLEKNFIAGELSRARSKVCKDERDSCLNDV